MSTQEKNLFLLLLLNPANRLDCNNEDTSQIREAGFYFNVRNEAHWFGCKYIL